MAFSIINQPFGGTPIYGNLHICLAYVTWWYPNSLVGFCCRVFTLFHGMITRGTPISGYEEYSMAISGTDYLPYMDESLNYPSIGYQQYLLPSINIQWEFQEPIYWRYLPYTRPIVQGYGSGDIPPKYDLIW